jgi:hypothetical protein
MPKQISDAVREYVNQYEFRGDEGDYTPTEAERVMLEDAICGFLFTTPSGAPDAQ